MEEGDSGRIPVIKIKIPKETGEEEDVPSHYCKECDRSFSSGKALGGHMSSAHVQANKEYSMRKAMSFNSNSKSKSSPGSPTCSCNICGRVFQSQKSLFGHMRCHPEREWRGMEPPRDAKSESSEELGFFKAKAWPTCKRGRPSLAAAMEEEKEKEKVDEMVKVAVQVLASGKMERKYRCDTCGRVFKSHEALGGHRASHNKFMMTIINTSTRHLEPKNMPKAKKKKMMLIKPDSVTSDHVDGDGDSASVLASTITPTSASTITPTLASGFGFDIDLNMSPPGEEEEEEVEDKGMEESSNDTSSRQ
ncbi:hypothetical protein SASPL_122642 [Salvia splendens]|uniref:C2H2-type domain-containing protein n=1 Tax=Salvia splendens TaxID=180675 RepID=A0A8X8XJN5_SALSN|nr:zinc finger protein ZAT1-like [Salvia splendens]KAG6415236.1 hypothetical protein SASPL_122642 [Salvia splendens]